MSKEDSEEWEKMYEGEGEREKGKERDKKGGRKDSLVVTEVRNLSH